MAVNMNEKNESFNIKTGRTFFTEEKIAAARKNIEKYDWAKHIRNTAVEAAERYLSYGSDFLWDSVTSQKLSRSLGVNQIKGCPVCGNRIDKYGNYPWLGDPFNSRWKLTCPSCGSVFPANDFGTYYKSGLDEHGFFDPVRADKSLLKNELYPDRDAGWGVDDGYGWVDPGNKDPETRRYTFIAYYSHWYLWYDGVNSSIRAPLKAFRDAYIYTGNPRYAQAGTILLDRIADVYPEMDSSIFKWEDGFRNSHGGSGQGKILGCIWETGLVNDFITAYDAFFPGMDQPEIIGFLNKKAERFCGLDRKESVYDIRKNIEEGILREVYPAVRTFQIRGNIGMHQSSLALAAVVLDDPVVSGQWIEYIFKTQEVNPWGAGNLLKTLVNDIDRDGQGDEASPSYNSLWLDSLRLVTDALNGYICNSTLNLYKHVKFRKMFHMQYPLILLDRYTPSIGDTKKAGDPGIICDLETHATGFVNTGDPILAQLVYFLNGNKLEGTCRNIFSDCEKVESEIGKVLDEYGPFKLGSTNMTGYGFTALRSGEKDTKVALWMYYGRNNRHGHKDTLNIGIHAFGLDLMPDHGYPCFADNNMEKHRWTANTISHNTVTVDQMPQSTHVVGIPHHYDGASDVKLIDVEAPEVYPHLNLYRRTAVLVRIDGESSYAVDFFRIVGGKEHVFSFHGAEGEVAADGLNLADQVEGTYAGEDIAFASPSCDESSGSGFDYLYNVARDSHPEGAFSMDWAIRDTWHVLPEPQNIHLRLTMLTPADEIAVADGNPPRNKPGNPEKFKYMLAKRKGNNLESHFVSVLEPYKGSRTVQSVSRAEVKVGNEIIDDFSTYAVKVVLENGRTDYIINSLNSNEVYTVDNLISFKGFMGICSLKGDRPVYAYTYDGTLLALNGCSLVCSDKGCITGTVVSFTRELSIVNEITVCLKHAYPVESLKGGYIYIQNDGARNAVYEIKGIKRQDGNSYTLNIGDITLIRSWADDFDFSKGYIYDIEEGAAFQIPLSFEWSSE